MDADAGANDGPATCPPARSGLTAPPRETATAGGGFDEDDIPY
jgi:hypothetical protein